MMRPIINIYIYVEYDRCEYVYMSLILCRLNMVRGNIVMLQNGRQTPKSLYNKA